MNYKTAAIIIDQWDDSNEFNLLPKEHMLADPGYQLVDNIKDYIDNSSDIDLIILASYSVRSECLEKNEYNKNNLKVFGSALYTEKIKQLYSTSAAEERTDPRLIDWNTQKTKISMHFLWELKIFLETNTVDNFFICGATFEGCLRDRPLGFESLYKFIIKHKLNSKIFIKKDLVLTESDLFFDSKKCPDWNMIDSDIFYYDPK